MNDSESMMKHTQQSSCSIDRTASGKYTISVKVYDDDPDRAVAETIRKLRDAEAGLGMLPLTQEG